MAKTKDNVNSKRPLYLELLFTVIAFLAMAVLSYIFMGNVVRGHLVQNAKSVLDFVEFQTTSELQEPLNRLDTFSRIVRNMLINGDGIDKVENLFKDLSGEDLIGQKQAQRISSHSGFFGYFEIFESKPVFIAGSELVFPADIDPTDRLWYRKAVAAGGGFAETLSYNDMFSGNTILLQSMCIFDDQGRRLGVIGQRIRIDIIGKNVVETALASGGYGMLISDDLILLAHPESDFVGRTMVDPEIPVHIFVNELLEGKEIFERPLISYKGEEALAFFRKTYNNWYIGLATPKDQYYKTVTNMAVILGFLAAAFSAVMAYILIRLDMSRNRADLESKHKSSFLANMSHEIRTPMNAILGITEIQLENKELPPDVIEALSRIYNSGDLLLGIINDILDLSKIEAGKMEISPVKYEIASLINDTVHLNQIRFEGKPIDFRLHVNENIPAELIGDELRIKQILNNLLSNAFKYTKKGEIELSVDIENNEGQEEDRDPLDVTLIFRVRDTGLGMTKDEIAKLFDRFTRFNTNANRIIEGTGLGMSITWNLVQMMRGNIMVESNPGTGSVFTVRLKQGNIGAEKIGKDLTENLQQFNLVYAAQRKKAQILREPMPYGKVLIVDDTESNLYVTKGLMVYYRLNIETVTSGFEAIDKIKAGSVYDVIFMDHMMPVMDGIEAVKIIRDMGYKKPIVALTANAVSGQADVFLSNGFDAFVSKPIDIRQLNALLNKLVRDKHPPEVIEAARKTYGFLKQDGVGSRPETDLQLLKSFIRDAEKSILLLEPLLKDGMIEKSENLSIYIINVHSLKSALANIGEKELSETARQLELAGRKNDFKLICNDTKEFLDKLKVVVEKCEAMKNEKEKAAAEKSADDAPGDKQAYLREKLKAVRAACMEFDSRTAETIIGELQLKTWPSDVREVLDNVSGFLLHSDFTEAAGVIDKYTG